MRSLTLLLRAFWVLSIIGFLVIFFLAYFYWPDFVDILFDKEGFSTYSMTRNKLFYSIGGAVLVINLLFIAIRKLLPKIADSLTFIPNSDYWLSDKNGKELVLTIFQNWINSFLSWINLFIGMFAGAIAFINLANLEHRKQINDFEWLLPVLIAILAIHIIYLVTRFFIKKADLVTV